MPILQKQILSAFTLVVAASAAAQSPKPAITGFVVDAQTKQPLVGAVVRVSGASVSPHSRHRCAGALCRQGSGRC